MRSMNTHPYHPRIGALIGRFRLGLLVLGLIVGMHVFAHGGQIEVGGGAKGPVHLSEAQQNALGLKLELATQRPLSDLLYLNGEVQPVAGRQAEVSTRISGQVKQISVTLGDRVKAGQPLARVQSRPWLTPDHLCDAFPHDALTHGRSVPVGLPIVMV